MIADCNKQLRLTQKMVSRLSRLHSRAGGTQDDTYATAVFFNLSQVDVALRAWITVLTEFAHKLIAQRDTSGAIDLITSISEIGKAYAEKRRNSVVLFPDRQFLLSGGTSDINEKVLSPIYESLRALNDDAVKNSNEAVVKHCIRILGEMALFAKTITYRPSYGGTKAPLSFSPCFFAGVCTKAAIKAGMLDAALAAVNVFERLASKTTTIADDESESQALDTLFDLAYASYAPENNVWGPFAVQAILSVALSHVKQGGREWETKVDSILQRLCPLLPLEVQMEKRGYRKLQIFPAFDLGFEGSIPFLLQEAYAKIEPAERPHLNPLHDFNELSNAILGFYRTIAKTDFEHVLARKWAIDSLIACTKIYRRLISAPPHGAEDWIHEGEKNIEHLVSWVSEFFKTEAAFPLHHATEAARSIAVLGLELLEMNLIEAAEQCGKTISRILEYGAKEKPDPYLIGDFAVLAEALARGAEALGHNKLGERFRAMVQLPSHVPQEELPHFERGLKNRMDHFERALRETPKRSYIARGNDPVEHLAALLRRVAAPRPPATNVGECEG